MPRSNRRKMPTYLDPSAVKYTGPLSAMNHDSTIVTLYENATVVTDSSGDIVNTFNNNPSSAPNWSDYSAAWDEYRVLGIKYSYDPNNIVNTAAISGFNGYTSIVHTPGATIPLTLSDAASTGVSRRWNAFTRYVREWRMSEVDEAVWVATSAPAKTSDTLLIYAEQGTISQYYGNTLIEYLVQFRSHRR